MLTLFTDMKWDKNIGNGQRMKIRHYCKKPGKKSPFAYLLMLPEGSDRVEIRHMLLMNQPFFKDYNAIIFGAALTERGAQKLALEYTQECYTHFGHYDVNKYFRHLAGREEDT